MGEIGSDSLGGRIRALRKARRLTQRALGNLIGADDQSVSDWENSRAKPEKFLQKLAQNLDTTTDWLLTGKGLPNPEANAAGQAFKLSIEAILQKWPDLKGVPIRKAFKLARERLEAEAKAPVPEALGNLPRQLAEIKAQLNAIQQERAGAVLGDECKIRSIIGRMPIASIPAVPHIGVAAADEGDGTHWDQGVEPGAQVVVNASQMRCITIRGRSAEHFAWDGQQAIIDADRCTAAYNKPCIIMTRDGKLWMKRKVNGTKEVRHYSSINPAYPALDIPVAEILAEWPVVAVVTESSLRSPVETFDEGPPPEMK